ncbi:ERF family protein [Staphylococcus saprophyticus]|nr:ERF family protein [Staphylococcus saprophyticus]
MNKSESIAELSKALANFHKEVKQPFKDKSNPFFKSKYVPLENVAEAIDTISPKFGLTYTQSTITDDNGNVGVATILVHESGEYIEHPPAMTKPEKNTPQGIGSALTYMRRYSLSAAFGITSDQDDDGNQASGHTSKPISKPDLKNIKSLEDEIEMFSQLLQSNGKDVPPEKVKAQLNIKDINQLTNNQIANMISILDKWSKQEKESK